MAATWTRDEDLLFEAALVKFSDDWTKIAEENWEKIAEAVPGKTVEQVKIHHQMLLEDIELIESGQVEIPDYPDYFSDSDDDDESSECSDSETKKKEKTSAVNNKSTHHIHRGEGEKKKGIPWTREEHIKFLEGLEMYGRSDWRSISRYSVITRTPTQVASHAQKFFLRQNSTTNTKKRSSIHDITIIDTPVVVHPQPSPAPPSQVTQSKKQKNEHHHK